MCGIFGVVAWDRELPPVRDLSRATNLLRHRGPDGGGYWHAPGVFLGHRRLAIIDLSPAGAQPMASSDSRYVITFNGEIYNYVELRDELRALGRRFVSASDTEVILAGYAEWGAGVAGRLEGMFAFGIYDRLEQTVFLARDRFGEKPLLVAAGDGRVAFSSELAPLAAVAVSRREIDREALGGYLALNYVPGTRTMLRGVERLAPAEWRTYGRQGVLKQGRYWSPPAGPAVTSHTTGDLLAGLQAHLDRATQITLRSDVPVGLFLSGGVDSSVVAESAARHGRLARAFCVDVEADGFSEWRGASHVAARIGVELERVPLDVSILGEFIEMTGHLDDPLADSSAMAVWAVSRAAGHHVKVVISGDGGDELFGGYITYQLSQLHRRLRPLLPPGIWQRLANGIQHLGSGAGEKLALAAKVHRFVRAMPLPTKEAHFTWNGSWLPQEAAALVADGDLRASAVHALDALLQDAPVSIHDLQVADCREYLSNDILAKVDRATMAHGLESRAPLLNAAVAEFALTLPLEERIRNGTTKFLLRELSARHFGRAHAYAPKRGFSIPVHQWLRHGGRTLLTSLLAPERVAQLGVLNVAAVSRTVEEHLSGKRRAGWELWGLMVLVAWFEQRVLHPPDVTALPDAVDLQQMVLPTAAGASM